MVGNAFKYNPNNKENNVINKGNWRIGADINKLSPTNSSGFYKGITPDKYAVYTPGSNGKPSIFAFQTDSALINFTNRFYGNNFLTVRECFSFYANEPDLLCLTGDIPPFHTDQLVLYYDISNVQSYPEFGDTIKDLSVNDISATVEGSLQANNGPNNGIADTHTQNPVVLWGTSQNDNSIQAIKAGKVTAPTSPNTVSVDLGFKPDLIVFQATNTMSASKFNNGEQDQGGTEYGWCYGAANFRNNKQISFFIGSGSASTNGMAASSSSITDYCINILELNGDGDSIANNIKANAIQKNNGFDLNFDSTGTDDIILYKAYKFNSNADADIGFFNISSDTNNQIVNTDISPNFVHFITQPRLSSANEIVQDSNDWGLGHGWLTPLKQYSMSFASYSNNVDDHIWGARRNKCMLIKHAESKGGVTGLTEATGTLLSTGFRLSYNNVEGNELVIYIALKVKEGVNLSYINIPSVNTNFKPQFLERVGGSFYDINAVANSTIESMSTDGYSGSNQNAITYGWSYGIADQDYNQYVLNIGASSNSINAHRSFGSDNEFIHLMYTDNNARSDGTQAAKLKDIKNNFARLRFIDYIANLDVINAFELAQPDNSSSGVINIKPELNNYIKINDPQFNDSFDSDQMPFITSLTGSVEVWFKPQSINNSTTSHNIKNVLFANSGGATDTFQLGFDGNNVMVYLVAAISNPILASTNITQNNWHSICVVYNSSDNIIIYHNASSIKQVNAGFMNLGGGSDDVSLSIGDTISREAPFTGNIASVKVYNKKLTQQQVTQNYNFLNA
jgi:hypothetical protein